jgi:hypothetical protein
MEGEKQWTPARKKAPKGEGYSVRVGGKRVLKSSLLEEQVARAQQALRCEWWCHCCSDTVSPPHIVQCRAAIE